MFWDAEIEKERQNKKQLFLKWLSTKDNNDKVQYKGVKGRHGLRGYTDADM